LRGGFLGLLFDRTEGLFPFWPVFPFACAGLVLALRDRRRGAVWLVVFAAVQWLVIGMFWVWTGGRCAPLRFWLPVMPLLIVGSVYVLARFQRLWLVGLMAAAMVFSVVIGARNITHPRALMKDSLPLTPNPGTFGASLITKLYGVFPDMKVNPQEHEPSAGDHVLGLAWLVVTAGFVALVVRLERGGAKAKAEAVKQEPST
jgi:hypothetical protein